MFELIDVVDKYFFEVINDEDFVLGLDYTGIYAFTDSADKEDKSLAFYELKKDLRLSDSQAVLCYVGAQSPGYQNEVPLDNLEQWIRDCTMSRPRIFTRDVMNEIEACYDDNAEEDLVIYDVLREYGLSDAIIHDLVEEQPKSIREIKRLGVVDEVADDVFRILASGQYTRDNTTTERVKSGTAVVLTSYMKKKCIASFVMVVASGILILVLKNYWAAIISSLIGLGCGATAMKAGTGTAVKIAIFTNVVLCGICVLQIVPMVVAWVQSGGLGSLG